MRAWPVKNSVELIHRILSEVRDRESLAARVVHFDDVDQLVVARHVERLYEDGMLEGTRSAYKAADVAKIEVRDLTTAGHALLGALDQTGIWAKLRATLSPAELAAISIKGLAVIAGELAMKAAREKLGL